MAKDQTAKKFYRIGEVSQLTGIQPHILRYWESEGQILAPNRRLSKQRLYRQADIDLILTIKRLLEDEKYTLEGVKQYLAESRAQAAAPPPPAVMTPEDRLAAALQQVREELLAIRQMMEED